MKRVMLALAALCICGGPLLAADPTPRVAGDFLFDTPSYVRLSKSDVTWSAALSGIFPSTAASDNSVINVYGSVGYFVSDQIELEGVVEWQKAGSMSGSSLAGGANFYFKEWRDNMFPYMGAGIATWFGDMDGLGTRVQAKVGMRHYLNTHTGLRYWAQYDTPYDDFGSDGVYSLYVGFFSLVH